MVTVTFLCRLFFMAVTARLAWLGVARRNRPSDRPDDRTTEIPCRLERGQREQRGTITFSRDNHLL
jgi:hypothetical protein